MSIARQVGITLMALAFSSALAHAATQGAASTTPKSSSTGSMFVQLDQNKDHYVDMKEAGRSAQVKSQFSTIDSDHDGKISKGEWDKYDATQTKSKR